MVTWSAGEVRVTQPWARHWPAPGLLTVASYWWGVFYFYPDLPNHLLKQVDGIISSMRSTYSIVYLYVVQFAIQFGNYMNSLIGHTNHYLNINI